MNPSNPSCLPFEILKRICDEVSLTSRESLKSCSLASHAFLHLSRRHLFQKVTLSIQPNGSSIDNPHFSELIPFLVQNANILSTIRVVRIQRRPSAKPSPLNSTWSSATKLLSQLLEKVDNRGLQRLAIVSSFLADWTTLDKGLRSVLLRYCHIATLHHLELLYMSVSKQELLSFVQVPKVSLSGMSVLSHNLDQDTSAPETQIPSLESRLRELSVTHRFPNLDSDIWSILEEASGTLETLACLSSPHHGPSSTVNPLYTLDLKPLPRLPHLKSLTFCLSLDRLSIERSTRLLEGVFTPSRVEILEICCDFQVPPSRSELAGWGFDALDAVLAGAALNCLQQVRVTMKEVALALSAPLSSNLDPAALRAMDLGIFRTYLPRTSAKGIIVGVEEDCSGAG
ncbi:unnamed protein product [Cyclocybe aegerita]|uniref:F-box domain-containing protein n=1 Tax=Cyclocybe aegerita TaxID=1973307 RepID=A0A8S0WQ32_CYCAE|nr:unnamed protein product [Cyclocybe aegerita]